MLKTVPVNSLIVILLLSLMAACAPTGIYHTVKPGQTLYRIAIAYDIEESRLAQINNIKDPKLLKANQRIYIPGVTQLRKVPVTAVATRKPSRGPTVSTPTNKKTANKVSRPAPPKVTKKASTKTPVKAVKGLFAWPVNGKVLNKFGKQGQKVYKGIEVAVPEGTTVKAAASGKVIYSGNAIPGYGNLVILEHSDSFFSVYGYNQKYLVKKDDHVGQGDKIALSGKPPSGKSARLHFEIRKGKAAVNPILYLP